ncbi:MAG TPA: NAD(P)/FAD-dependent oxidoreductase [Vicinamibacterales bacterium]|nr:NAD(P)/FAD-dependent oxidoreductase [Vicinamibacterales bacterium]
MAGSVDPFTAHDPLGGRSGGSSPARSCDVAVVGAGAAGLATAIFAGRANASLSLVVADGAPRPGAKILVSGGSRCNVTNRIVTERDFRGGRPAIVRRVLRAFPAARAAEFFRNLGVPLHEEADGKLFPDSNRSRDVLDALLREAARLGAAIVTDHRVTDVRREGGRFIVASNRGDISARRVVLATGGQSLPKSGSDGFGFELARRLGHRIVEPTPALAPLLLHDEEPLHRRLSGVSQDVEVAVWVDGAIATRVRGAMLWTHFGVSGPAALNASRHWARARVEGRTVRVTLSFAPGRTFDEVEAEWTRAAGDHPRTTLETELSRRLPASAARALLQTLSIDGSIALPHVTREDRRRLIHALTAYPLPVTDTRGYTFAEATAGGVALDEVDPATLESRRCPGLHLVGEILDVDGRLGGFNFQWAWSSGFVAGAALARLC